MCVLPSASFAGVISSQKVAKSVPEPYRCVVSLARRIACVRGRLVLTLMDLAGTASAGSDWS